MSFGAIVFGLGIACWFWLHAEMRETQAMKDRLTSEMKAIEDWIKGKP